MAEVAVQQGEMRADQMIENVEQLLANAALQAGERNYAAFPIVDVDAHHFESNRASWLEISRYIEHPVIRHRAETTVTQMGAPANMVHAGSVGDRSLGGRIRRYGTRSGTEDAAPGLPLFRRAMEALGTDYAIIFPTTLLNVGTLPEIDVQVALMWGYARWLTERVLPSEPTLRTMICLPFNDPAAALRMVEAFGDRPGVVGFVVGSNFYRPVHHRDYLPVYAAIQELGRPLAFHSTFYWQDRLVSQFNKFLLAHGIGRTLFNIVHLANWVINGLPVRFPKLRVIWIESGLTWLPFLMQRLDSEYMMRSSEAPLLEKRPSEYMQEFYYSQQPMERTNLHLLEATFEAIHGETQVLYASDYPHWDFDLPSSIYDLPFLNERAKRRILGGNAMELFNLPAVPGKAGSGTN